MFKCLLLQSWHSLSDPKLEQSLRVRLDFLAFTGFSIGSALPDETSFCKFRNKLIIQNKIEPLFNKINQQLEGLGLKVKSTTVAIVDATLIDSQARPSKVTEGDDEYQITHSKDSDAKWLKKGKRSYFGYRAYARCDKEGFIDKTHVESANCSEMTQLSKMVSDLDAGVRVQADKGFSSHSNRAYLQLKKLKNGLTYKAYRNPPLDRRMKQFNKLVSKTRFRIEQCFGTLKRRFEYRRASYRGKAKVNAEFMLKAICQNLLKVINKVSFV